MKGFKRWLGKTVVLGVAATLVLSACGNNESSNPGSSPSTSPGTSSEASSEPAESAKPVTLKFVMMGPGKQADSQEVWDEFNKQLETLLPNTKVEFEPIINSEFADKWKLMAAASEPIDIAWTGYLLDYPTEVNKGSYMELDELVNKYGQDIQQEIPSWVLDRARVNGKLYAIPNYQQSFDNRVAMRVPTEFIDKGYIDPAAAQETFYQYGPVSKESFAVIEAYLEKLKANNELRKGFSPNVLIAMMNHNLLTAPFMVQDGKVVNWYELEKEQLLIRTMSDWFAKGYIRKDMLSLQNQRQDEGKPDGNVAWFHAIAGSTEVASQGESTKYGFPITLIPMEENYMISALSDSTNLAIPRTSQNPERAMQLLNLLNSSKGKELYNLLTFGIEGKHYKKISDTRIETIGYTGSGTSDAPYGQWNWALGSTANSYETQAQPEGNVKIWQDINNSAIVSPLLGYKPNLDPIRTELAQVQAVVKEYAGTTAQLILESGAIADHEQKYQEFIDKMKKAGSEKVAAELQRQIDEFMQTKK